MHEQKEIHQNEVFTVPKWKLSRQYSLQNDNYEKCLFRT